MKRSLGLSYISYRVGICVELVNNTVDLSNVNSVRQFLCGTVGYFNNRKASGELIRGTVQIPGGSFPQDDKLVSVIDDSATLGFL